MEKATAQRDGNRRKRDGAQNSKDLREGRTTLTDCKPGGDEVAGGAFSKKYKKP